MVFVIKHKTDVYEKPNWPLKSKKTLAYTETSREDWRLAQIKQKTKMEINQDGKIKFENYSNLDESTPFTDSLNEAKYSYKKTRGAIIPSAKTDATGKIIPETNQVPEHIETNCELCGKPIKISHIIICERKNIWMEIGDICRKKFTDAEDPLEQIRQKSVQVLRCMLKDKWQRNIIFRIRNRKDFCKKVAKKFEDSVLYADFKKLYEGLVNLDVENASDKEIVKIWRLALKAFTNKDPNFLPSDLADILSQKKWESDQ